MHLGHARTFWIAYQRALAARGVLIFRNEDLDEQRSRSDFAGAMIEDLRWLGIEWSEGPDIARAGGGPFAPYQQSQRRERYATAWQTLVERGYVYPCRCSRKDLARLAQAPHEDPGDDEPLYPGTCRPPMGVMARRGVTPDEQSSWRFRVPDGEVIEFVDSHLGPQRYVAGRDFGDFLVWRRDDVPSYQLAVVVDDAAMEITEVVRGADLLKSTARQILLYRALGLTAPAWYHCSLVVDERGQRLAKRHDALSLRAMREAGLSPEQVRARFQQD
jgi:glutamyl-tRNA synthetase